MYNYCHSRARRVIENVFGILFARWRIYNTFIQAKLENVEKIVLDTIVLHNYLREIDNTSDCLNGFIDCERSTGEIIPGHWRKDSTAASLSDESPRGAINIGPVKGCRSGPIGPQKNIKSQKMHCGNVAENTNFA